MNFPLSHAGRAWHARFLVFNDHVMQVCGKSWVVSDDLGRASKLSGTFSRATRTVATSLQTGGAKVVGTAGFEPATPRPPVWCASQAALRPGVV